MTHTNQLDNVLKLRHRSWCTGVTGLVEYTCSAESVTSRPAYREGSPTPNTEVEPFTFADEREREIKSYLQKPANREAEVSTDEVFHVFRPNHFDDQRIIQTQHPIPLYLFEHWTP